MLLLDLRNLSESGRVRIGWTETGLKSKTGLENTSAKSEPDEKQLSFPASAQRNVIPDELACTECTLSIKFKARFKRYAVLTGRINKRSGVNGWMTYKSEREGKREGER